jgi:hypothetical protein
MALAIRDATRPGRGNHLARILLIFRGNDEQWAALRREVSSLGGHEPVIIESTTGLDIKGLVTYMALTRARELTTSPLREALGLRGFSIDPSVHTTASNDTAWLDEVSDDDDEFDDDGGQVTDPDPPDGDRGGQGNKARLRRRRITSTSSTSTILGPGRISVSAAQRRPRQVIESDLELQFGVYGEGEYPRWLAQLSNPPRFQNTLYSMYRGYLQDARAGSDVHIYILDGPVHRDHPVSHYLSFLLPKVRRGQLVLIP